MIYTELTEKAARIMYEAHKGQTDRCGLPYCFHPWHVAESMEDEYSTCAALLHDTVEDTDVTLDALKEAGFPQEVLDAVSLLTHEDGTDYFEYVERLSHNAIARAVKLSDLRHNSDLTRLPEVTPKDLERLEKYWKCIAFLTSAED